METLENNDSLATPMVPVATGGYMAIIDRLASLDNIDADKLERLMVMQERYEDRRARILFDEVKAKASQELKHIKIVKTRSVGYDIDKNDKSKGQKEAFKFAALEDIDKLIAPVLAENKIDVSYKIEASAITGWHTIVCWLEHGGHREPYPMPMPLDTSGGKGNAQAMGSTQSYGQRRALCGAFNIITIGLDDDGAGGAITDEQAAQIKDGLKETGLDVVRFLKAMKVDDGGAVEDIRIREFTRALAAIENKRFQNKKSAK